LPPSTLYMRVLALKVGPLLPGRQAHRVVTQHPTSAESLPSADLKPQADALAAILKNSPRAKTQ
jgi:hypothetical protein